MSHLLILPRIPPARNPQGVGVPCLRDARIAHRYSISPSSSSTLFFFFFPVAFVQNKCLSLVLKEEEEEEEEEETEKAFLRKTRTLYCRLIFKDVRS